MYYEISVSVQLDERTLLISTGITLDNVTS